MAPATQIVPEVSGQLTQTFEKAQRDLASSGVPNEVWAETVSRLQDIDLDQPMSLQQFVQAHSCIAILEQALVAVISRDGFGSR